MMEMSLGCYWRKPSSLRLRTPYLADALRNLHGVKPYPSRRHAGAPKDVRAQSRIETVER